MTKKTDWENFCQQRGIAEDEIKTQLFNGELSEKDFSYINKNIQDNVFLNGPRYSIDYYRLFNDCPHLVERCFMVIAENLRDFRHQRGRFCAIRSTASADCRVRFAV